MPVRLDADVWLTVKDESSRTLRFELVPKGTDLPDRLLIAHSNYTVQGWECDSIKPGFWNFYAAKDGKRILVGFVKMNPAAPGDSRWPTLSR
jgi:hypothetical protein